MADTSDKKNNFLEKLLSNVSFKEMRQVFCHALGNPIWWFVSVDSAFCVNIDAKQKEEICDTDSIHCFKHKMNTKRDLKEVLHDFKSLKEGHLFICPHNYRGFCFPLIHDDKILGYIVLCHVSNPINDDLIKIFKLAIDSFIFAIDKDLELTKLYDTVRPRAIALSTIHTVHRLISSILKLDELMPRIARLVLQVLRAEYCTIYLVDEKRERLEAKAVVDLTGQCSAHAHSRKMGVGIEGKVAKNGNALLKPYLLCVPLLHEDIIGVITVRRKEQGTRFSLFDKEILWTLAEQAVIAIKNAQLYDGQERMAVGTIKSLATILNVKSPHAYTHTAGFVTLALEIGKRMGMGQEELQYLHYAALLPDAGKVWIPEKILEKPSELTKEEYLLIKQHPMKGVEIIQHIDVLKPSIPIVLHHHERYDGKGYPDKLKGVDIPLGARIMAVCDAFEAMITKRPYRPAKTIKQALQEIVEHAGGQFDPAVVAVFVKLSREGFLKQIITYFKV